MNKLFFVTFQIICANGDSLNERKKKVAACNESEAVNLVKQWVSNHSYQFGVRDYRVDILDITNVGNAVWTGVGETIR